MSMKNFIFNRLFHQFLIFQEILTESKFSKWTNTNYRNDNRCSLYCVLLCWCKPRNNGKLIKISLLHHFSMVAAHYQFETFFVKTRTLPKIFYFLTDCYITVVFWKLQRNLCMIHRKWGKIQKLCMLLIKIWSKVSKVQFWISKL